MLKEGWFPATDRVEEAPAAPWRTIFRYNLPAPAAALHNSSRTLGIAASKRSRISWHSSLLNKRPGLNCSTRLSSEEKIAQMPCSYSARETWTAPFGVVKLKAHDQTFLAHADQNIPVTLHHRLHAFSKNFAHGMNIRDHFRTLQHFNDFVTYKAALPLPPPDVEMWANPSSCSQPPADSFKRQAEIGYIPPERPFAVTIMSG